MHSYVKHTNAMHSVSFTSHALVTDIYDRQCDQYYHFSAMKEKLAGKAVIADRALTTTDIRVRIGLNCQIH